MTYQDWLLVVLFGTVFGGATPYFVGAFIVRNHFEEHGVVDKWFVGTISMVAAALAFMGIALVGGLCLSLFRQVWH